MNMQGPNSFGGPAPGGFPAPAGLPFPHPTAFAPGVPGAYGMGGMKQGDSGYVNPVSPYAAPGPGFTGKSAVSVWYPLLWHHVLLCS